MSSHRSKKRASSYAQSPAEEEPLANDLEIAAAYAMAQYVAPPRKEPPSEAAQLDDCNEIDVSDEDSNEMSGKDTSKADDCGVISDPTTVTESSAMDDHADVESDAESDIDLTDDLKKMQNDEEIDDEDGSPSTSNPRAAPQTTHEVDGYHGSVEEVEQVLGTSLQVEVNPQYTQPAGHIQHFMVEERILVIRSLGNSPLLLEEGNALVLREPEWIPLGRILEVFGPVSQPLYSVRLPDPKKSPSPTEKKEEGKEECEEKQSQETDPWSVHGKYTKWVAENPGVMVHYLPQQAKLVDTHVLLARRVRGCDASNVHDEEVQHPAEMDYSDDEQERQARQRGRRKGSTGARRNNPPPVMTHADAGGTPGGFHISTYSQLQVTGAPIIDSQPPQEEADTEYFD